MVTTQETLPSLKDKVALITGATGKLGRRLVESFATEGATVAFCSRRTQDLLPIEQGLRDRGCTAYANTCDVRDERDVVRLVHRVMQRFGRVDVLVNAASMVGPRLPLMDYPADPWFDVVATNLNGTFLVCREVLPWMTRQRSGSIVNVSSTVIQSARPQWGAFLASKCGIEGLTQMLASEVRDQGIRVNVVDFGTPRADNRTPQSADDWSKPFLWLASDQSTETTGQRIRVAAFLKAAEKQRPN